MNWTLNFELSEQVTPNPCCSRHTALNHPWKEDLLSENWYVLPNLRKIKVNGISQNNINNGESESPWSILVLYPLYLEIDYYMANPTSMLSYFQARNACFVHLPQPFQDNHSMQLIGFSSLISTSQSSILSTSQRSPIPLTPVSSESFFFLWK